MTRSRPPPKSKVNPPTAATTPPRTIPPKGIREIHRVRSEAEARALWKELYPCIDPACSRPDQPHTATILRERLRCIVASIRIYPVEDHFELSVLIAPEPKDPRRP